MPSIALRLASKVIAGHLRTSKVRLGQLPPAMRQEMYPGDWPAASLRARVRSTLGEGRVVRSPMIP